MPRFYQYNELITRQPMPLSDILWLAGQVSKLPPFLDGVAVLCGSVAWGQPSWRSDIDVIAFKTEAHPDVTPAIDAIIRDHQESTGDRFLIPRADVIVAGAESQRLATRKNLVRGSADLNEKRTVREVFAATSLRFFDHIGSLAAAKDGPWRTFHSTYLSQVSRDRHTRRDEIRTYATSFADAWRQQPLRSLSLNSDRDAHHDELSAMGFAENFPIHLMRQILAERDSYPIPDRAPDVRALFVGLPQSWAKNLLEKLNPFLNIGERYAQIADACRGESARSSVAEYHTRLVELFINLPFADVEEAVWNYLKVTE